MAKEATKKEHTNFVEVIDLTPEDKEAMKKADNLAEYVHSKELDSFAISSCVDGQLYEVTIQKKGKAFWHHPDSNA